MSEPAMFADVPENFRKGAQPNAHQRQRHRVVLDLLRGLSGEVLDYGCGYGDLTHAISRTHAVRGVDVDAARIAFAQDQYAPIPFAVCGDDRLAFADATFDVVTSVVVLPFVPDPDVYLREIHRVLKPGGHLILVARTQPWLNRLYQRWRSGGERERGKTPWNGGSTLFTAPPQVVEKRIVAHGFDIQRRGALYDPPFENHKNLRDLANSLVELVGERLALDAVAPYPVFLARRCAH